jgi:hypothetical protein
MFELKRISDDEIDYFDELKLDTNFNFLDYISDSENLKCEDEVHFEIKKTHKVTANIATQPKRYESLLETLKSIDGQFDEIRLYLNNFDYVPGELSKYTTHIGKDLTDNGKFFWSENPNEYYFSLDDDIIYPPDYVEKTLPLIGNRIVSYHGRRLTGKNKEYYGNHKIYMFSNSNYANRKLDVLGTGVTAFDTSVFKPTLWKSPNYCMTDLVISLEAHIYGVPIICPKKERNWLYEPEARFDGIYFRFSKGEDILTTYCDMIQTLIKTNIDIEKINYQYDDESVLKLSNFIKSKLNSEILINMRTGNGNLIERVSYTTGLNCSSYDTDHERINECNQNYLKSKVFYKYLERYTNLNLTEKDCFIIFDDLMVSKFLSTKIFNNLKTGSHLICHNFVNNVFPDDKIVLKLNDGQEVEFYYYFKK